MAFFRKKESVQVLRPTFSEDIDAMKKPLDEKMNAALTRLDEASRGLHKKKSICGFTALELVLEGLKNGKLKREDL